MESNQNFSVGLVYHPLYLQHDPGPNHPESPSRLLSIYELLEERKFLSRLTLISPRMASLEELTTVHDASYIKRIENFSKRGGGYLTLDTALSSKSYESACLAAGGILSAIDEISSFRTRMIFCLIRPPGHHALADQGMGFCLFNNLAIGAKYALEKYKISRILIIDWDVHHGNGIQEIFYSDPRVLYVSLHQYPLYPGTGSLDEVGLGEGEGFTINLPFPYHTGEQAYMRAFEEIISPVTDQFEPQLLMIAAGYDGHFADPLASLNLMVGSFAKMTAKVKKLAKMFCQGRLIFSLEGGYNLKALSHSVLATLNELAELGHKVSDPYGSPSTTPRGAEDVFDEARRIHEKYWKL